MLNVPFKKVVGAVCGLVLSSGMAFAEDWKFVIEEIQGSVQDTYAQEFKKRIESRLDDVTVTVYHHGALGTSQDVSELVSMGAIQFANIAIGNLGTLVPEVQVFSVPYVLSDDLKLNNRVLANTDAQYFRDLSGSFSDKGIKLVTMYSQGDQVWTTNKAIHGPDDFDGFKMRVMNSPLLVDAYQRFGADPTPLPFGEVYSALQLKQVDGQVNPVATIEEMKFYEVTSHMIWAGQQQLIAALMANDDWFASLPEHKRKVVQETVAELVGYVGDVANRINGERLEVIKKAKPNMKMVRLSETERQPFRQVSEGTRKTLVKQTGSQAQVILDGLINALLEEG